MDNKQWDVVLHDDCSVCSKTDTNMQQIDDQNAYLILGFIIFYYIIVIFYLMIFFCNFTK